MNLAQLRTAIYARAGQQSNDPNLTTQVVDGFVNEAMHLIEAEHDWPWLLTKRDLMTQPGIDTYGFPADWLRTRSLRIAGWSTMTVRTVDELDDVWLDTIQGQPTEWAVDTDQLLLRPIPDAAYTVTHRYLRAEPDLTSDSQSPLMPTKFHGAIVQAATWQALGGDREEGRAGACFQAYQNWLLKMKGDVRRALPPARVRIRGEGRRWPPGRGG